MRPYCQRISSLHPSEEPGLEPDLLDIRPSPVRRSESNLSQMTITQRVPGGDGKIVLFVCITEWHAKTITNTICVQMPYLHYETDEGRQKMTDAMKLVGAADETSSSTSSPNMLLLQAYLRGKTKIHPRRTLDQFFYHGLDTSARDRDQVVYRYCESQGELTCPPTVARRLCTLSHILHRHPPKANNAKKLICSRASAKDLYGRSTLAFCA